MASQGTELANDLRYTNLGWLKKVGDIDWHIEIYGFAISGNSKAWLRLLRAAYRPEALTHILPILFPLPSIPLQSKRVKHFYRAFIAQLRHICCSHTLQARHFYRVPGAHAQQQQSEILQQQRISLINS